MKNLSLLNQIDQKRLELHRLIKQTGNLLDPVVLQKSQQLDRLIVLAYKQNDECREE
jgi:hypothetical protein